jgi:hypothetical protein
VHLPSPHVGTALRTAAPTIRTTTTGGGSLNLRKVADPKGARDPLTARPTITDNRPRDRYPEVATGIQWYHHLLLVDCRRVPPSARPRVLLTPARATVRRRR